MPRVCGTGGKTDRKKKCLESSFIKDTASANENTLVILGKKQQFSSIATSHGNVDQVDLRRHYFLSGDETHLANVKNLTKYARWKKSGELTMMDVCSNTFLLYLSIYFFLCVIF